MPNETHQADLLFLPGDRLPRGQKVFKYTLTVVDVASRYKEAESLTSKDSAKVLVISLIYKRGPLQLHKLLHVDHGRRFMGSVSKLLAKHHVSLRHGIAGAEGSHREQAIVERFNRTLAEPLFGHQYDQ